LTLEQFSPEGGQEEGTDRKPDRSTVLTGLPGSRTRPREGTATESATRLAMSCADRVTCADRLAPQECTRRSQNTSHRHCHEVSFVVFRVRWGASELCQLIARSAPQL